MKRKVSVLILLINVLFINLIPAQDYTLIPDKNFEQALIDLGIDNDGLNGKVLTEEIRSVTSLVVYNRAIRNLTGIEDFDSLASLNCSYNHLTSIDVSNNGYLKNLNCSFNNLTGLNINANHDLEELDCSGNRLTTLDLNNNSSLTSLNCHSNQLKSLILTSNTGLLTLLCASNQLKNLNISVNTALTFLDCSGNQLKSLNVTGNSFLTYLTCSSNQLASLNVSNNDSLTLLSCSNNQLHNLNITNNTGLKTLICASNQLTSLNVSNNADLAMLDLSSNLLGGLNVSNDTALTSLNCSANQLTDLNIRNGKNTILATCNSKGNPRLTCIKVDDPVAANSYSGWQKDDFASYNVVCMPVTYVPDDNFEVALAAYDDVADDNFVPTANIETLVSLDLNNLNIKDLTGIEDFTALDTLICSHNLLFNLDMSQLPGLVYLDCSFNTLAALAVKNELAWLDAVTNPFLTCIRVDSVAAANADTNWFKDAAASYNLDCNGGKTYVPDNNFEQALIDLGYDRGSPDNYVETDSINSVRILDVSGKNIFDLTGIEDFISLDSLNCSSNKLSSLNISNINSLKKLSCYSNFLTDLNVRSNDSLIRLICGDNKLDSLNISLNTDLLELSCDANELTELDVSGNIELLSLNCGSNFITGSGFDLSENINLVQLYCSGNELAAIDVTENTKLDALVCADNHLTSLDISNDTLLRKLDCSGNFINSLDISSNVLLEDINCNSNQIVSLDFGANLLLRNLRCDDNQLTGLDVANNDSLRNISASANKLKVLDVSNNRLLYSLNCNSNILDSFDVSSCDSLRLLSCENNKLSELILTNNRLLKDLDCDHNQLTTLNISLNESLSELSCSDNDLGILDVSSNLLLRILSADNNQLAELITGSNDSLSKLSCSGNHLETLDLSNNSCLTSLISSANHLVSVNVKNGNNNKLTALNLTGNPNLACIEVDDPAAAYGAAGWQKDVFAFYNLNCHYNETYVPDDAFEQALITLGYDSGPLDDHVLTSSINTITGLDISAKNITDLTGIKDFVNLKSLNCSSNLLDTLDTGWNTALTALNCAGNQLVSLELNNNTLLEELNFSFNNVAEIDLKDLTSLKKLTCDSNELTTLELSHNVALIFISSKSNRLAGINLKNGHNTSLTTFEVTGNPELTCIEVDDPSFANAAAGWHKDAIASYNVFCHYTETYVPDDAFEQALKDMGYDSSGSGPLDDYVPTAKISRITDLYLGNKGISDLTGIQDFMNLISLNCRNNLLTELNVTGNVLLENLNCSGNQLTELIVSSNTALKKLNLSNNLITGLDISADTSLTELNCASNQLTSLNITRNPDLKTLNCNTNQLISIDANNGHNQYLIYFDLRNNPGLRCVLVDDIAAAEGYPNWFKDPAAHYKLECNDDDNDGVPDTEDHCLTTPYGDKVDLFGCSLFRLPANNFSILTTSETCRSSNNGKINVAAVETYNYKATLTGDGVNNSYNYTNSVEIRNLRSGAYKLCLTIEGKPDYMNCYDLIITEPQDLSVLSSYNQSDETVLFKLSGGISYTIDFNGLIINTTDASVTLNLEKGRNTFKIKTDSDCQGIYEKTIFLSDKVVFYPNPFDDYINVSFGKDDSKRAYLKIYSYSGQLVLSKIYPVQDGSMQIDASSLGPGIYMVSLKSETIQSTFEIVKK